MRTHTHTHTPEAKHSFSTVFSLPLCLRLNKAGPLPSAQAWVDNLATRTDCVNIFLYSLIYSFIYLFTYPTRPRTWGGQERICAWLTTNWPCWWPCLWRVNFFLYLFLSLYRGVMFKAECANCTESRRTMFFLNSSYIRVVIKACTGILNYFHCRSIHLAYGQMSGKSKIATRMILSISSSSILGSILGKKEKKKTRLPWKELRLLVLRWHPVLRMDVNSAEICRDLKNALNS